MKRKVFAAFLAILLCFTLTVTVSAENKAIDFVVDELGCLTDREVTKLNALASDLYQKTGVGIFFVYADVADVEDYDLDALLQGMEDYVIMLENETHWIVYCGGLGERIDKNAKNELREVYDVTETYVEGVEDFLNAAAEYFPPVVIATAPAPGDDPIQETHDEEEFFFYDEAGLLTQEQSRKLEEKLKDISHTHQAQIVVCTMASMEGMDIDEFLTFLYDEMNLGYGNSRDGVLLLVSMDPREYRILSNGMAADAIGTDEIDILCGFMDTYLPDGHYYTAFDEFADQCAYYIDGHLNGFAFDATSTLMVALIIGIVAGLITAFVLKGQLKTVRKQNQANMYTKPNSMTITTQRDIFLYRDVSRTRKESSSSSSSSGSSRNTGGGSF